MLKTISAIATQIISSITGGLVQFTGPAAGTTRVITVPNANATMARTDASQSFTGDQTLGTGNLIQGTAGKGINFTANTNAPGMTSELLNWYEEGTWTPVATSETGSITTYTSSGTYTRIGRQVYVTGRITVTNAGTAGGRLLFSGLPFTLGAAAQGQSIEAALTGTTYFISSSAGTTSGGIGTIALGAVSWTNNSRYDFSMVYSA